MTFFLRPVRFLVQALTAEASPRQCAMGFSLGMVVGLVPKGNLTAMGLMFLLCMLRINLGAGMLAVFLFSWVGLLTDPLSHDTGMWLLSHESLAPLFTTMYNAPVIPWTAFNNTVVLGSLVLGLLFTYPAFRLSEPLFAKYVPRLQERLRRRKLAAWLFGAEWAGKAA